MEDLDRAFEDFKKGLGVQLKNYVAIILDKSGSMESIQKEALQAFNEQIKILKKSTGEMETYVSCITFGTEVDEPLIWCGNVKKAKKIKDSDYKPEGLTALYDAVGTTITKLKNIKDYDDENTSFLIIIITDGFENASKEYNSESISKLITELQETNRWTFTYLGSNQDLAKVKDILKIPEGNMMSFVSTHDGTSWAVNSATVSTAYYMSSRTGGNTSVTDYYSNNITNTTSSNKKKLKTRN